MGVYPENGGYDGIADKPDVAERNHKTVNSSPCGASAEQARQQNTRGQQQGMREQSYQQ